MMCIHTYTPIAKQCTNVICNEGPSPAIMHGTGTVRYGINDDMHGIYGGDGMEISIIRVEQYRQRV